MTTLGIFVRQKARRFGDKPLFITDDVVVTYADYDAHGDRLAVGLAGLDVGPGDRVAVLLSNGIELLLMYLATARRGAVTVPLNPMFTPREIEYVINNSGAKVFVTSAAHAAPVLALRAQLPSLRELVVVGDAVAGAVPFARLIAPGPPPAPAPVDPDDVAMILYTSGTTGHPKGAMLTHAGLLDNARAVVEAVGFRETDRSLCMLPLFHVFAIAFDYLQMMTAGGSTVILERFDAGVALRQIERHRVTVLVGVPTMFVYLFQHPDRPRRDLSSLRIADTGGGPVPAWIKTEYERQIGMVVLESYGLTEASPVVTIERPGSPRRDGACGQALPGIETRVVDAGGRDVPPGELGELLVRGRNVMKGYFQMPEATRHTIVDGWLRTGDLVREDADGHVYMVDRLKHMIICGGYNIYPKEVESVLHEHPAVLECALVGVPDPVKGEIPKACIVLRDGAQATAEEIEAFCRRSLAAYKVPRVVEFMTSLPRTASGKVRKVALAGGERRLKES
jgi:long-chain acyl-CoA synthetase